MSEDHAPTADATSSRMLAETYRAGLDELGDFNGKGFPPHVIGARGGREEFDLGAEYCASADPLDRVTGADILAHLGSPGKKTFVTESVDLLIPLLSDPDLRVLSSTASALGHREDPRAIPHFLALEKHPHFRVRFAVVNGLSALDHPEAIACLMRMAKAPDEVIRDWSIFGLGSKSEVDTPEIRQIFIEALEDEDEVVRAEAIGGLANRRDPRTVAAILKFWETEPPEARSLEAAELMACPELAPPLRRLLAGIEGSANPPDWKDKVTGILARCESGK